MAERFPPMRPSPSERLDRVERESGDGVLYLNERYRRLVIAALGKAYRDGVRAARLEMAIDG